MAPVRNVLDTKPPGPVAVAKRSCGPSLLPGMRVCCTTRNPTTQGSSYLSGMVFGATRTAKGGEHQRNPKDGGIARDDQKGSSTTAEEHMFWWDKHVNTLGRVSDTVRVLGAFQGYETGMLRSGTQTQQASNTRMWTAKKHFRSRRVAHMARFYLFVLISKRERCITGGAVCMSPVIGISHPLNSRVQDFLSRIILI